MSRKVHQRFTLTGLEFSPNGLKAPWAIRNLSRGLNEWARQHLIPLNQFPEENAYLAYRSVSLRFDKPSSFFDATELTATTTSELRDPRLQLNARVAIALGDREIGSVSYRSQPLWVSQDEELGGRPAPLPRSIAQHFRDDERKEGRVESPVADLVETYEAPEDCVGKHSHEFTIYRHQCEHVDQWIFSVAVRLLEESRCELILGAENSELRETLGRRLKRLEIRYDGPYFLFDRGSVETKAYNHGDEWVFIHRLVKPFGSAGEEQQAVAVEIM